MEAEKSHNNYQYTLNELLYLVRAWIDAFRNNSLLFLLAILIGGGLGLLLAYQFDPVYKADCRFVIKEQGVSGLSGSLGGLTSLLGGSASVSAERSLAFLKSERIVGPPLLKIVRINGLEDLLINHLIRVGKFHSKWKKDSLLRNVQFNLSDTIFLQFNISQRKAYKNLISLLLGIDGNSGILSTSLEKKSGVAQLSIRHKNEDVAIMLNKVIFNEFKDFVREQAAETAGLNVSVVSKKVDSIQRELNAVRRELAKKADQSLGILLNEDKVELKSLAVKEQILLTMYGEAQKNLETMLFMAQSSLNAVNITLLEAPYSPIKPIKKSKLLFIFLGVVFALFLTALFIVIRGTDVSAFKGRGFKT
jgi:hypothetical protein